jgi:hypothetical protein
VLGAAPTKAEAGEIETGEIIVTEIIAAALNARTAARPMPLEVLRP